MNRRDPDTLAAIAAEHGLPEDALREALGESHPDASPSEVYMRAAEIAQDREVALLRAAIARFLTIDGRATIRARRVLHMALDATRPDTTPALRAVHAKALTLTLAEGIDR